MKIKASKDDLLKAIGKVISAINPRSTLPILSNILVETVGKDTLRLVGTDLEIGIINTVAAEITEEGAVTIPAKKLLDIVREAPERDIEIGVTKSNAINIKCGKAFFKLMGLPKDDYLPMPAIPQENAIAIEKSVMRECITLTAFAISTDETRYVLNGALLILKNKELKMIATDGRRLAAIQRAVTIPKGISFEAIVPTKAINEVVKNLEGEGTVALIALGNQVVFQAGGTTIISRLIEGHYPNYEQVIPGEGKIKFSVEREKLLAAVRRVSLLTSLDSQAIKCDVLSNKMILSSRSPNLGESKEEIDIQGTAGEEMTIGFNPAYLIDVLKNLDTPAVTIALINQEKPGVVQGKEGYIYVIMPMQIG